MSEVQGLAGLDLGKVGDVVGAIWDKRDDMGSAVDFIKDHSDDIVKVLSQLPELFANTASALTGAAEGIQTTAAALNGPSGDSGVAGVAKLAGDALSAVVKEVAGAQKMLAGLGEDLAGVPLMDGAGKKVIEGAQSFASLTTTIESIGGQLSELSDLVAKAASALHGAGEQLAKGGQALGSFSK